MHVQSAGFGCGLLFNANGFPTILPVTVLHVQRLRGPDNAQSAPLTCSFCFLHRTCAALSLGFVLSFSSSVHQTFCVKHSALSSCYLGNGLSGLQQILSQCDTRSVEILGYQTFSPALIRGQKKDNPLNGFAFGDQRQILPHSPSRLY